MTNAELIAKIKAEIERLKDENKKIKCPANERYCSGYDDAFYDLVPFLSTLESEKPMEGLEEEIKKEMVKLPFFIRGKDQIAFARHFAQWGAEHSGSSEIPKELEEAARRYGFEEYMRRCNGGEYGTSEDAFIAGAKWQKEQMLKDGLNAVKNCQFDKIEKTIAGVFVKYGMDMQKQDMLKEAVEGEVCGRVYDHINVRFADGICKFLEPKNISHIPADVSKYKVGDKVCVIVCKKED